MKICVILWGIWHWRNKNVWDDKMVTPVFAMDSSFQLYSEWTEARKQQVTTPPVGSNASGTILEPAVK